MRRLVSTLINSIPNLVNVIIFLFFIFTLFGIFGLQLFFGSIYNRCRISEKPINETYWPKSEIYTRSCSMSKKVGYQCPENLYCGNPD
jgi:hypothetical protein